MALVLVPYAALANEAPLPPPRPDLTIEAPREPPAAASGCLDRLREAGIDAQAVAQPSARAECVIEDPVRLAGLRIAGAARPLGLPDAPVVACRFALAFAGWATTVAYPVLTARRNAPVAAIRTGPGHECRTRNRLPGAKMSAHAQGLAIDIAGFDFASGPALTIGSASANEMGLAAIRTAACGWFTTVLGPGSDAAHGGHLHLDIQQHGSSARYRICQ